MTDTDDDPGDRDSVDSTGKNRDDRSQFRYLLVGSPCRAGGRPELDDGASETAGTDETC